MNKVNPSRLLSKGRMVLIVVMLLVLGAGLIFVNAISQPVNGVPTKTINPEQTVRSDILPVPPASQTENLYFSLILPPGFQTLSEGQGSQTLLYTQMLRNVTTAGTKIVTIGVSSLPSGGLTADSSYGLRTGQPNFYQAEQTYSQGEPVIIFSDAKNSAVVAFWEHGDYLATVSVTSGQANSTGDVTSEKASLTTTLEGLRWKL